jgi:hypothetical protein
MPRAQWPLVKGRPVIEIILTDANGNNTPRTVVADTGSGSAQDQFDFVLEFIDCIQNGGYPLPPIAVSGAYSGTYTVFAMTIEIPALQVCDQVSVVGVPFAPPDFDGIACFRFLNRFTYGNFGDKNAFGLET